MSVIFKHANNTHRLGIYCVPTKNSILLVNTDIREPSNKAARYEIPFSEAKVMITLLQEHIKREEKRIAVGDLVARTGGVDLDMCVVVDLGVGPTPIALVDISSSSVIRQYATIEELNENGDYNKFTA